MENILYKKLSSKGDDGSKYDVFVNFYDKNLTKVKQLLELETSKDLDKLRELGPSKLHFYPDKNTPKLNFTYLVYPYV